VFWWYHGRYSCDSFYDNKNIFYHDCLIFLNFYLDHANNFLYPVVTKLWSYGFHKPCYCCFQLLCLSTELRRTFVLVRTLASCLSYWITEEKTLFIYIREDLHKKDLYFNSIIGFTKTFYKTHNILKFCIE